MQPERQGVFIQTWQQLVLAVAISAVLPLVGLLGAIWLATLREWRDAGALLLATVIGALLWSMFL